MGAIYSITNSINNKVYIGLTTNKYPNTRWSAHKVAAKRSWRHPLYHSMAKYGIDKFRFSILEVISDDRLCEREIFHIKELNSLYPNGYNLTKGGQLLLGEDNPMYGAKPWNKGIPRTDELKKYLSSIQKQNYISNPNLKRFGDRNPMYGKLNPFKGRHHTKESVEKNRMSQKGRRSVDMLLENKVIKSFASLGEAAEWVKKNTKYIKADYVTIRKSIVNSWRCYGFNFKFKEINYARSR